MITINNDPRIHAPTPTGTAFTTNYCDGSSSDDIVAHEWGHAYTEYTSGLIYQWQPGAMNEAYSDIWGETVDLINDRQDDDEGDLTTRSRGGQCSTHTAARRSSTINSPSTIAKICQAGGARSGRGDRAGVTGDVALGPRRGRACRRGDAAGRYDDRRLLAVHQRRRRGRQDRHGRPRPLRVRREGPERARRGCHGADHRQPRATPSFRCPATTRRHGPDGHDQVSNRDGDPDQVTAGQTVNVTMKDAAGPASRLLPLADGRGSGVGGASATCGPRPASVSPAR